MANEKKLTKAQKYDMLLKETIVQENPIYKELIEHEMELLEKKNTSKSSKPTKRQTENEDVKEVVLNFMNPEKKYTVSEILKYAIGLPEDITNQRMSAILRQMTLTDKTVIRTEEKGRAYFSLVVVETDED